MQAWEVLKALQEGKEARKRFWKEGTSIRMSDNPFMDEDDQKEEMITIAEHLDDDDSWEVYDIVKFKEGDWVYNKLSGKCHRIKSRLGNDQYYNMHDTVLHANNLRLCTEEEILHEQARIEWAKWNRKVNEYKLADLVRIPYGAAKGIYEVVSDLGDALELTNNESDSTFKELKANVKMVATVGNRVDLS